MDDVAFFLCLADRPSGVVDLLRGAGSLGGKWPLLFGITPTDISTHSRLAVCVQSDLNAKTHQRFSQVGNEQLRTAVVHRGNSNERRSNQSNTHRLPSSKA